MAILLTLLLLLPLLFVACLYLHFHLVGRHYWSKRNLPHLKPVFLLGNMWRANISENFLELIAKMHGDHREKKVLGLWMFTRPAVLVMDVDIIKRMLIKDFNTFRDRGMEIETLEDPLARHLFMLSGKEWRNLRVRLTPTFTSGKMKMMFPTMLRCGATLEDYLRAPAVGKEVIEVKDILARFTTDVISSCAFGLETNSLQNPKSEFRELGRKIVEPTFRFVFMDLILSVVPKLNKILKMSFFPKEVSDFFIGAIRDTIDYRERTQTTRNDFLQLLIQLMRTGKIEDVDKTPLDGMDDEEIVKKFSLHDAAAQCFIFFFAGFETSATALTFALYELALNPDIQRRLQEEIDETLEKNSGEITYDALNGMEYLDMIVHETLRKYPPAGNLMRKSNKPYHIPELDVTLDEETFVFVSVTGLHRDPDLYPDPDRFDPERFTQEEKARRDACAFLPFGEGPRNCIGNRFALMQIKVGLLSVFRKYSVEVCRETPIPIKWVVRSFTPTSVSGMPLTISTRS